MIWRAEVYDVDLGHPVGHEPAFTRPAVVVSTDIVNNGPGQLVVLVPIGSVGYGLRSHVAIDSAGSGLNHASFARCDQIRVVSTKRLVRPRGMVSNEEIDTIDDALRFMLDL